MSPVQLGDLVHVLNPYTHTVTLCHQFTDDALGLSEDTPVTCLRCLTLRDGLRKAYDTSQEDR